MVVDSTAFSEITLPVETKVHMEHSWDKRLQICENHWEPESKMATMAIYGKTLKRLFLRNRSGS